MQPPLFVEKESKKRQERKKDAISQIQTHLLSGSLDFDFCYQAKTKVQLKVYDRFY